MLFGELVHFGTQRTGFVLINNTLQHRE